MEILPTYLMQLYLEHLHWTSWILLKLVWDKSSGDEVGKICLIFWVTYNKLFYVNKCEPVKDSGTLKVF